MPDIKITEQEPIKFLINDSYEQLNRSLKQVPIDDGYYHQNNIEQLALCDKVKEEVLISGIEAGKYLTSKFNAKPYEIDLWFSKYFSPFEHCKSEKNEVLYTTHKEVGTHYKYDYKKIDIEKFTPGEMYRLISFTDLIARPLWELDVHTSIQILDKARINRNLQVMRRDNCYIDLTDTDFYGDSAKNLLFSQEKLIKSNNTKETKDSFINHFQLNIDEKKGWYANMSMFDDKKIKQRMNSWNKYAKLNAAEKKSIDDIVSSKSSKLIDLYNAFYQKSSRRSEENAPPSVES